MCLELAWVVRVETPRRIPRPVAVKNVAKPDMNRGEVLDTVVW